MRSGKEILADVCELLHQINLRVLLEKLDDPTCTLSDEEEKLLERLFNEEAEPISPS